MPATPTEPNPSLRRTTFETHAQPAMTDFITGMQKEMATETPPNGAPPDTKPEPTPEPKPEPKPESKPESKTEERPWPRSAKDWDAYKKADKERLDKLNAELAEVKSKYESAEKQWKTTPAIPPDYESLKKEREDLDQRLRTVAVEQHPKFRAYFDGKVKEQLDLAEKVIGGDVGKEIVQLLQAPDGAWKDQRLSDILTSMTPLQQTRVGGILNNLTAIASEKQSAITRAKESHDQILAQEQAKLKENRTKAEQTFEQTAASLQDKEKGSIAYQLREGDQKWNESVKARIETARNLLFNNQPGEVMIRAALDAVSLPAILEHSKSVLEENAALKKQISELQSAQPSLESNRTRSGTETPTPVPVRLGRDAHTTPQDAVAGFMQGYRQALEEGE